MNAARSSRTEYLSARILVNAQDRKSRNSGPTVDMVKGHEEF
jgi:hypothetical protein